MTPEQRNVIDAIRWHIKRHREPPTYAAVARVLGISYQRAWQHVQKLRAAGYVRRAAPNEQRALELTDEGKALG